MSYMDGLKEKVAGVLYKNLSQWKQKISTSPASELKSFIVQEFARMEMELIEYNQILLQRVAKKQSISSQPTETSKKDTQIKQLYQNNLRLLALVHVLLDSTGENRIMQDAENRIKSVEKCEISEKGMIE